jgi:hypothetical protein
VSRVRPVVDHERSTHKYADVRTSIDLPDDLLRRAKITAVERGTTLRELVEQALVRELALHARAGRVPRRRAEFPVFPSKAPGTMEVSARDLRAFETEEDVRRHGPIDR